MKALQILLCSAPLLFSSISVFGQSCGIVCITPPGGSVCFGCPPPQRGLITPPDLDFMLGELPGMYRTELGEVDEEIYIEPIYPDCQPPDPFGDKERARNASTAFSLLGGLMGVFTANLATAQGIATELVLLFFGIPPAAINELLPVETSDGLCVPPEEILFKKASFLLLSTALGAATIALIASGGTAVLTLAAFDYFVIGSGLVMHAAALGFDYYANDPPNFDYGTLEESQYIEVSTPPGSGPLVTEAITFFNSALKLSDAINVVVRSREKLIGAKIDASQGIPTEQQQLMQIGRINLFLDTVDQEIQVLRNVMPSFIASVSSARPGIFTVNSATIDSIATNLPSATLPNSFLTLLNGVGITESAYRDAAIQSFSSQRDALLSADLDSLISYLLNELEAFSVAARAANDEYLVVYNPLANSSGGPSSNRQEPIPINAPVTLTLLAILLGLIGGFSVRAQKTKRKKESR